MKSSTLSALFSPVVIVSALGYFVDVFDLILFSVLRVSSLKDLGLSPEEITVNGVFLINTQMIGMLVGGVLWGVLGDKAGRVKVLFGSIILYSASNICNAFVQSVEAYAFWRFLAGVGLAGEIGAGITLVAEVLPKEIRGYGTTIVASIGLLGAVVAGLVGEQLPWRAAYTVGGVLGIGLLVLRVSVHESGLFSEIKEQGIRRGDLALLVSTPARLMRYLKCVLVGLPTWLIVGILVTFSPELAAAMGAPVLPRVGVAIIWCYVGLFLGDAASGLLSQALASRKRALLLFVALGFVACMGFLRLRAPSIEVLYFAFLVLGFTAGFWVLTLTAAAEQFGTNLRATVATSVPNFIRGALVPMTLAFSSLKEALGAVGSAEVVVLCVFFLSIGAVLTLDETFSRDLDYLET